MGVFESLFGGPYCPSIGPAFDRFDLFSHRCREWHRVRDHLVEIVVVELPLFVKRLIHP